MWSGGHEKLHAFVPRSTFPSQNVQSAPTSDHFWKLRCRKNCARRCGSFGCSDVSLRGKRKALCTLSRVSKTWGFCSSFNGNYNYNTLHTLHCIILHYATLHYTTLTLHYTTPHYTTPHYTTLHYTTLRYITLRYTPLYSLHYARLHLTTLHYTNCTRIHSTTLHSTSLHFPALHYTTLI